MPPTDPIADLLTRLRNANMAKQEKTKIPSSKIKHAIVDILKREGYIRNYRLIQEGPQGTLRVYLKYGPKNDQVIHGLTRLSKPSLHLYVGKGEIPRVLGGLGTCILSTSRGLMTDHDARRLGVGGELLCKVW